MRFALILSLVLPAALALSSQAEARRAQPQLHSATYTRHAQVKPRVHHASHRATHARRVAQARARTISPAS